MTVLNATEARANLYSLIDETANTHQPIVITGKRANAVLVSEEVWNAISETLYYNLDNRVLWAGVKKALRKDLLKSIK